MVAKKRRTPTPITATIDDTPPVGPQLEFLNTEEDAWYNVQVVLIRDTLIVKYTEFQHEKDVVFHAKDFDNSDDISMLKRRFRAVSPQLEASDCWVVEEGMRVCALRVHSLDDRRFYDAIVEAVKREEHKVVDETENCSCTVVLSWLHGPNAGTLTTAKVEDLCLIQSHKPLDSRISCFLELAKWMNGLASPCSKMITKDIPCCNVIQNSEGGKQTGSAMPCDEETFGLERNKDVDLGGGDQQRQNDPYTMDNLIEGVVSASSGERDYGDIKDADKEARYFILVENMEKDVSPSTIVKFVKEAIGLKIEAFVFISLASEPYTRGALVVDSVEDLQRLCTFVVKTGQMITSSKGRPWIVSEESATESVRPSFWCLEPDIEVQNEKQESELLSLQVQNEKQESAGDGLKIVKLGSEEYCKAERLRDLFVEFAKHQQLLFNRLVLEEQSIFDS